MKTKMAKTSAPLLVLTSGAKSIEERPSIKKTTGLVSVARGIFLSMALLTALGPVGQVYAQTVSSHTPQSLVQNANESLPKDDILFATSDGKFAVTFNQDVEKSIVSEVDLQKMDFSDLAGNSVYHVAYFKKNENIKSLSDQELLDHTGKIVATARHFLNEGQNEKNPSVNLMEICKYARPALTEFNARTELSSKISGTEQTFSVCSSQEMISTTQTSNVKSFAYIVGGGSLLGILKAISVVLAPIAAVALFADSVGRRRLKKEKNRQEQSSVPKP